MSFLKSLFGGKPKAPPPPPPEQPAAIDPAYALKVSREAVDAAKDPIARAEARKLLANNLVAAADMIPNTPPEILLNEAEAVMAAALAETRDASAPFRADLLDHYAKAAFYAAPHLQGDMKGQAYADAVNRWHDALVLVKPRHNRPFWFNMAVMCGAAMHEMGLLRDDEQGLKWLDEAATIFDEAAANGLEPPQRHTVADYNRYVSLEARAHRSPKNEARRYFEDARRALVSAMTHDNFAAMRPEMELRLAQLDEALK